MILAAHQPQFAPWLGYFDKMDRADVFVLLDNVQFKKNEWQNRNRIKGAGGAQWLTVPVSFHSRDLISDVKICNRQDWRKKHAASLESCYGRAPHIDSVLAWYRELLERPWERLDELNVAFIEKIKQELAIPTPMLVASTLELGECRRDERLIALCRALGADTYLAGAGGHDYMDLETFQKAGIRVLFQDFRHPVYPQLFGEFAPALSVVDLLSNCGPRSSSVLRGHVRIEEEAAHERSRDRLPSR